MANRHSFRERLANLERRRKPTRTSHAGSMTQNSTDLGRSAREGLIGALLDILFNGWWFFLAGLAFAVLAGLMFLDLIGFNVGALVVLALIAFICFSVFSDT